MKSLQLALAAIALSAACAAHAQSPAGRTDPPAPKANASQTAQPSPSSHHDTCVGPASFCNIYFGS